jgi:precorrin-2 dehydrogenase/sirohydrochlorin ferrochelatase
VDSPAYCSFIFPAVVVRGDLVVGISTGGKAPGLSGRVRKFLDELLPESLAEVVAEINAFRSSAAHRAKETFSERAKSVLQLAEKLFEKTMK